MDGGAAKTIAEREGGRRFRAGGAGGESQGREVFCIHAHALITGSGVAPGFSRCGRYSGRQRLRLFLVLLLQAVQEIGGALRMRGCSEDRALVALEDFEPVRQIGGVVFPRFGRDAEISAKERAAKLCDQLLERVGLIAEPLPEFARHAASVAGPVDQLVRFGGGVAFSVSESLGGR